MRSPTLLSAATALACLSATPALASWTLVVQSYGGTVSVTRGLTKAECDCVSRALLRTDDLPLVDREYQRLERDARDGYQRQLAWRASHPQCKHVMWSGPPLDKVGVPNKDGWCEFKLGTEPDALGSLDSNENQNPDINPSILEHAKNRAYQNLGFPAPGEDGKSGDIKRAECLNPDAR